MSTPTVQHEPAVSVVIGVRDAATSLRASLDSVLEQADASVEVIVVDDGSADDTPARLAAYAARDARVRVLTEGRRGLTHALAAGCAVARGEFVARQDVGPSTRWLPGRLARTVDVLRARSDVVLVACGTRALSPRGELLYESVPTEEAARAGLANLDRARFRGPSSHAAVTFRRSAYDLVGGYREAFRFAQDVDLWLRLLEHGAFASVPEILVERGVSPDGSSGAHARLQRRFAALALEAARRRRAGASEAPILARAAALSARVPLRPTRRGRAAGRYFLGSCLRERDPAAARRWFDEALAIWPLHVRALVRRASTRTAPAPRRTTGSDACPVRRPADVAYASLSIVLPTWRREGVLVDTVRALLALPVRADEIVIVDQSRRHDAETRVALGAWAAEGKVRIVRRAEPSLPAALNHGFCVARGDVVLCLDDDIVPSPTLVAAHLAAHRAFDPGIVAGRVLQPSDVPPRATSPRPGPFTGTTRTFLDEFMGGNFSAPRRALLALGGFDERFVKVAYRNERELAARLTRAGGRILFEPAAEILHLQAASGGVRAWVSGARTARPAHAVGEYYYLLRSRPAGWVRAFLFRPWRHLRTRDNLRRPWRIPATAYAEVAGMLWALSLYVRGPRLLDAGRARERIA